MNILFINPPQIPLDNFDVVTCRKKGYPAYPPMGLGYLAGEIKQSKKHQVELYDNHLEGMLEVIHDEKVDGSVFWKLLENKLVSITTPDIVGISIMFSCLYKNLQKTIDIVRKIHPLSKIVVGGSHASMATESLYDIKSIDYIFTYESEETFIDFLDRISDGTEEIKGIAGVHSRDKSGNFIPCKEIPKLDIGSRPWPAWKLLGVDKYYLTGRFGGAYAIPGSANKPFAPLLTSRGCRGECAFCTVHKIMGRKVRMRPCKDVVDEIEYLVKEFNVRFFEVLDDDFTFSLPRAKDICREIIRRKLDIVWTAKNGLIICSLDREVISLMSESGCRYVQVGVESGNEEMLKWIRKPLTIPKLLEVRQIFRDYPEIYLAGYFIIGFPNETVEMMRDTYNLAIKLELDWSAITMAQPLPNSRMYEAFVTEGIIKEDEINFNDLTFFHNTLGNKYLSLREILDMWYEFNIGVNFINNPNLLSGEKLKLERAIRDFTHVGREIAPGHAMAIFCLGKAYEKLSDLEKAKSHIDEALRIADKDNEWKKWFHKFNIKKYDEFESEKGLRIASVK
ncbi:MAG: radical SAM protein [Candidatus Omnitrophica bacterium]|nr:radical SAM protein [Candidatus Omnitrophota bacterium]